MGLLRGYDPSWLRYDLVAGVSVAAVALPTAIAYSALVGVPAVNGLYASILPLVAYAFLGSSRQLIMAPDAATCTIVAATVLPLAGNDAARYLSLTVALAIITGLFCIAAGLARLGFLTNFLSRPILTGYLNGIALSIISGQLGRFFGFAVPSAGFGRLMYRFFSRVGETHVPTLAVGVGVFVLLRVLKRFGPKVPAPLVAVVAAIVAARVFHLDTRGVALVGAIPPGLPPIVMPSVHANDVVPLTLGAAGLALISFNSAMVTARSFAVKNRYELDSNREFVALGMADIGAGLLQGFAVSGADSRTAVNDSVGGKTQVTGLVTAGVIVLVLLFFTGPLAALPIAALAAILINSALGLFDVHSLVRLWKVNRAECWLAIITLLGVITVGVLPGVVVAVGVALVRVLAAASHPNDGVLGRMPGSDAFFTVANHPGLETFPGLVIYRFDAALLFFNADHFKARVRAVIADASPPPHALVIDAETMGLVDTTGTAVLAELAEELGHRGVVLAIAAAKTRVRQILQRAGLEQQIAGRVFQTVGGAVEALAGRPAAP